MSSDLPRYQKIIDEINSMSMENMMLISSDEAEVVVRENFSTSYTRYPDHVGWYDTKVDSLKISLMCDNVTERYLIFLLYKLAISDGFFPYFRMLSKSKIRELDGKDFVSFLEIFAESTRSVRLKYQGQNTVSELEKTIDNYCYLLSRNSSALICRVSNVFQLNPGAPFGNRYKFIFRERENLHKDFLHISAPQEMIQLFQTAFSSSSPEHQFINFYKVVEYQIFGALYEYTLRSASSYINSVDFDSSNLSHIDKLIKITMHNLYKEEHDFRVKEIIALEKLLIKYDIARKLEDRLEDYSDNAKDYFKGNRVSFSSGGTFNLDDISSDATNKRIAERIYSTRNSIIHNKVFSSNRYFPMRDEKDLQPEVMLLRCIAEIIIENYLHM